MSNRLREALRMAKQSGERRLQEEQKAVGSLMIVTTVITALLQYGSVELGMNVCSCISTGG